MKTYIIIAHTGQEIIDSTQEAQRRFDSMKYFERRYKREQKSITEHNRKLARNPLWRLATFCGIV